MHGWRGRILWVNLSKGTVNDKALDPKVAKDYIGGRGLGIYILRNHAEPAIDALSPDNPLIMATGPLTGTGALTGARYMVTTKSPLTGAITSQIQEAFFRPSLNARVMMQLFLSVDLKSLFIFGLNGETPNSGLRNIYGGKTPMIRRMSCWQRQTQKPV